MPDKTAVEDVQGETQSREQPLIATAIRSAARPSHTQYVGTSAIGETVPVTSPTLTPTRLGDDYHGFEGAPPTGSRVTIDFDLAMVPAASSLSQGWSADSGGRMRNTGAEQEAIPLD